VDRGRMGGPAEDRADGVRSMDTAGASADESMSIALLLLTEVIGSVCSAAEGEAEIESEPDATGSVASVPFGGAGEGEGASKRRFLRSSSEARLTLCLVRLVLCDAMEVRRRRVEKRERRPVEDVADEDDSRGVSDITGSAGVKEDGVVGRGALVLDCAEPMIYHTR
jgi:hypothetical protein